MSARNSAASPNWWRSTRWRMRSRISSVVRTPISAREQGGFELLQQVGVDFLLALERVFESVDEAGARLLHAALQFLQKGWLLLDGAEKSLNHFSTHFSVAGFGSAGL